MIRTSVTSHRRGDDKLGMTASTPEAVKVAIVGGGCAGLATAWQLAKAGGYDVTVYEKSWRLGGKGASGRDAEGRILEHGLHVWLGFYENAFAMMRECYDVVEAKGWGPNALSAGDRLAHGSIEEAFVPEPRMSVAIPPSDRSPIWTIWSGDLPPSAGLPGTPLDGASNPFTLQRYLERCFELLKTLYLSTVSPADEHESTQVDQTTLSAAIGTPGSPDAVLDWMARRLRSGAVTLAAVLAQAVTILEHLIGQLRSEPRGGGDSLIVLILAVLRQTRKFLADVASLDSVERTRADIVDIVITIAVGLYKDRILFDDRGFDAVNDLDYTVWLRSHGASEEALHSRFLMGIYDFAFAYDKGDINQPRLAAGVALRSALRMFLSYRGSPFWRMPSGMGDTVFAPLYRVLSDKGVEFKFMSELTSIDFENANSAISVGALHFSNTAPTGFIGAGLDHLGCWPDKDPRAAAPSAGPKPNTLRSGEKFDVVVVAAGFDDFRAVTDRSMINDAAKIESPQPFFSAMGDRWTDMRAYGATVATQSCQIWFDRDLGELGWRRSPGLLTAFHPPSGDLTQPPFQAIADMTVDARQRGAVAVHAKPCVEVGRVDVGRLLLRRARGNRHQSSVEFRRKRGRN